MNDFLSESIVWDAHACPTLDLNGDLSFLRKYLSTGYSFVSLNVGFEPLSFDKVLSIISDITKYINQYSENYVIAKKYQDIVNAKRNSKLAISFDIEGVGPLERNVNNLNTLYELGVKQVSPIYNNSNYLGGGCFDIDEGLTNEGYDFVEIMNEKGIVIDCSHVGKKSSLNIIEHSSNPIVFSHSNPINIHYHQRNIYDEQIIACAKKGGVVGVNGINLFLKNGDISVQNIANNIEYLYNLVGSEHVGIGLDYVFEHEKTLSLVKKHPNDFPNANQYLSVKMASPTILNNLKEELYKRGLSTIEMKKILGLNFLRVASDVWKE